MGDARDGLASIRWWPKDWRASTARAALSPAGRGVYLDLLFAQFLEPDCHLPDDDRRLAALGGVSAEVWAVLRSEVLEWLPVVSPGKRQNARMAHEWRDALEYRERQRANGRSGGQASVKRRLTEPQATVKPPTPFRSDSVPTPTPTPTPTDQKSHPKTDDSVALTAETCARALKKKIGSSLTPCRSQIAALLRSPGWDVPRVLAAIESIATAGMAPWDFVKAATGQNGKVGMTPQQILAYGRTMQDRQEAKHDPR